MISPVGYIIGPSAWCPSQRCFAELFNLDTSATQSKLREYDHQSHDLLGGLQLVAKALEVWFEAIAGFLIYLVIMEIASKKEGLPIGYIMTPFEFSSLPAMFDVLMWKIAPSFFGPRAKSSKSFRHRVYLLLLLTVLLCALCNLMGPSTAVLALPSLQWIETAKFGNVRFVDINASNPPLNDSLVILSSPNCTQDDVASRNFSCSADTMGRTLDTWLESQMAGNAPGATQQGSLTFSINNTYESSSDNYMISQYNNSLYWSPNRNMIAALNVDFTAAQVISLGYDKKYLVDELHIAPGLVDTYLEYNRSLSLSLQRKGPMFGSVMNEWYGFNGLSAWSAEIDGDRQLRCYGNYNLATLDATYSGNYTKCITIGTGWGAANKAANFSISGSYDYESETVQPDINVSVYASRNAVFLPNGTIPEWLNEACLANGTVPSGSNCDWQRLFDSSEASLLNRSTNVNTVEMEIQKEGASAIFAVDFVTYLSFTTYVLDASPLTNPMAFVQTQDIADNGTSMAVDPAWTLAAWSAAAGASILPDRSITRSANTMMQTLLQAANLTSEARANSLNALDASNLPYYMAVLPVAQTLSLIDFRTDVNTQTLEAANAKYNKHNDRDPDHPILQHNARMNVWAYGISSRTAVLGSIVAVVGIIVTLTQFFMAIMDRRQFRTSTQLLIAALEHTPKDEFEGRMDEVAEGRVRFHIKDDGDDRRRLTFTHAGWS